MFALNLIPFPNVWGRGMSKPLHSAQYKKLLDLLRVTREECGYTQRELAAVLGEDQSYVSKCELGLRRLDVIELRNWIRAMGLSFRVFSKRLDSDLEQESATEQHLALRRRR